MSMKPFALSGILLALSISLHAQTLNVPSSTSSVNSVTPATASTSSPNANEVNISQNTEDLAVKEATLKKAFPVIVTKAIPTDEATNDLWKEWATEGWKNGDKTIYKDQAVVVVNRNPHVQQIAVMIAHPDGTWTMIGVSPTSTGASGREKHFISPTGIFDHDGSIMDYRALGTKNEYGIRGIGAKGSRVWDFGWQNAQTGWLKKPEIRQIRFELHATDPDILEKRLGHPASEGCIRISAGLNHFLDHYSILDEIYVQEADDGSRAISALLPKDRDPILSGRYMMVVDFPKTKVDEPQVVKAPN